MLVIFYFLQSLASSSVYMQRIMVDIFKYHIFKPRSHFLNNILDSLFNSTKFYFSGQLYSGMNMNNNASFNVFW